MDLLAHELARLRGRRLAFPGVAVRPLQRLLFRHAHLRTGSYAAAGRVACRPALGSERRARNRVDGLPACARLPMLDTRLEVLMRWMLVISVMACFVIMYFFFFPDADRIIRLGVH